MANFPRNLSVFGAWAVAAMAWHCDGNGTQGGNPDLSMYISDMAVATTDPSDMSMGTAAAPTITTIAPAVGPNLGGTAIAITGTSFALGATVSVGGAACTQVNVVSATSITCTAPSRAAFCGAVAVAVTNPDQQKASKASGFAYQSKSFGFAAAKDIANAATSRVAVWADFNGDGHNDIVNENGALTANLTIELGNGDGTFTSKGIDLGMGNIPAAVAAGDMNGDNFVDLVVVVKAAQTQPQLLVLLGQNDGTFKLKGTAVNLSASSSPAAIALGTADNKQKPYVVVASTIGGKAAIDELSNDGTGTLTSLSTTVYGADNTSANDIVLADA